MGQTFWQNLFCFVCEKDTKHRCYVDETPGVKITGDNKADAKSLKEKIDKISPFDDPKSEWECWSCKSKGIKTTRRQGNAFLTLKTKKEEPKTEIEEIKFLLERLAEVVSSLEDRIELVEEMFFFPRRKRGIQIVKEESSDKARG